jgi:hypothetical protein
LAWPQDQPVKPLSKEPFTTRSILANAVAHGQNKIEAIAKMRTLRIMVPPFEKELAFGLAAYMKN